MSSLPVQIVLCIDLERNLDDSTVFEQIPQPRNRLELIRASSESKLKIVREGNERSAVDWSGASRVVASAVSRYGEVQKVLQNQDIQTFVMGNAPLPLFALAGNLTSAWSGAPTIITKRKDGQWDRLPTALQSGVRAPATQPFFDYRSGLAGEARDATGLVAVFVSVGQVASKQMLQSFVRTEGESLAGVVECRPSVMKFVDETNACQIASELAEVFDSLRRAYPESSGVALFVAGPSSLAFMVGRALNVKAVGRVLIPNFNAPEGYEPAVMLPLSGRSAPEIDGTAEAKYSRLKLGTRIEEEIRTLQGTIKIEDLPTWVSGPQRDGLYRRLKEMQIRALSDSAQAGFNILTNVASFGADLLEVLRGIPEDQAVSVARQVFVHEVYHSEQNLLTSNYHGIGRAGFALEEIDYWADSFAIALLTKWAFREGGPSAEREAARTSAKEFDAALKGIEVFDRAEQGPRIERLYERRLRRYLIWHLQAARGRAIRYAGDLESIFAGRIVAELAPLRGALDERHDKLVLRPEETCELVVVAERQGRRFSENASFSPRRIVDDVRDFRKSEISRAMDYVVAEWRAVLAPWR